MGYRGEPPLPGSYLTPAQRRGSPAEAELQLERPCRRRLVSQCELRFSSARSALRGFAAPRCRDAGVFIPGRTKVKVGFDPADWKSGKVGTCTHLSVVNSSPALFFFLFFPPLASGKITIWVFTGQYSSQLVLSNQKDEQIKISCLFCLAPSRAATPAMAH